MRHEAKITRERERERGGGGGGGGGGGVSFKERHKTEQSVRYPEFGYVTGSMGIFCSKRRAKSVHGAKGTSRSFSC